jgi:phosphoglycolate phosphatase-like HAD superfamily hydrolase
MPTSVVTTIFLDDGGVMNDNALRGPEWQRLVGEYLSQVLEGYLEGMGVRDLFRTLYGPDLVNTAKQVPEYHSRIFEDAGVEPGVAVVVDDSPLAIAWAREAGAMGVLVSAEGEGTGPVIPSLAVLPAFLASLRV